MQSNQMDLNVVHLGDYGVGKSTLVASHKDPKPANLYCHGAKRVSAGASDKATLLLWEPCGHEKYFTPFPSSVYHIAHAFVFVYDPTNPQSLTNIETRWLPDTLEKQPGSAPMMLVATKCDLADERTVTSHAGRDFAEAHGMMFAETSGKTGEGIDAVYEAVTDVAWWNSLSSQSNQPRRGSIRLPGTQPLVPYNPKVFGGCAC